MMHFPKGKAGAMAKKALMWGWMAAAMLSAAPAYAQDSGGWTGFYAGVDGGGARGRLSVQATDPVLQYTNINPPGVQPISIVPSTSVPLAARGHDTSLRYGALAGFQFQSGHIVFGIEADVRAGGSAIAAESTQPMPLTLLAPASSVTLERDAKSGLTWSARARIGYASGSTLVYATGGIAGAHVRVRGEDSYTIPAGNAGNPVQAFPAQGPFIVTARETRDLIGWSAGIGFERRIAAHVRLGLDARYSDYGTKTFALANATQTNAGPAAPAPFTAVSGEGAYPGPTRVSLSDAQLAVRLTFAF